MTPERRLEILTKTRDLIADRRRWGKGTLEQHPIVDRLMMRPPSLCLMGAIMHAANGHLAYSAEVYDVLEFLGELVPHQSSAHGSPVTAYNDRLSTTHSDVMFLVDTAIFHTQCDIASPAAPVTQDEQHEGDDRQDDQDRPQHGSDSTHPTMPSCVKVDCPPLEQIEIDVSYHQTHPYEPGAFAREVAEFYGDG